MANLRIRCDLIFDDGDPAAEQLYDQLVELAPSLRAIDTGGPLVERSRIELHRCLHGEGPEEPCEPISSWTGP